MVSNRLDEHVADYQSDYSKIKELALKEKQLETINDWMSEKIMETYITLNKENQLCDFASNWQKN